ncbi:glycosyltransferase [Cohnella fermenti]|uniref:Glycosyltransferase n=1 Tax=Cohnella fermenti TaxID=2565925 RepID=A0A4S4C516_9BACL|nr:glycosyltransferase [Cohnella fermenti]THF80791.1 glycosyltransferase [Cohnella fermenti]
MGEPRSTVSVVMAVHNGENYLARALRSLEEQSTRPDEIIVVDDGSTDQTARIVQSFPNVKYIYQNNHGPSKARNRAIGEATGDYIAIQDADDVSLYPRIATQLEVLDRNVTVGIVYCDAFIVDAEESILNKVESEEIHQRQEDFAVTLLNRQIIPCMPAIMGRRECFLQVPYPEHLKHAEDYWLSIEMAKLFKFHYIKEPLYLYRRHEGNLTNQHHNQLKAEVDVVKRLGMEEIQRMVNRSFFETSAKEMLLAQILVKISEFQAAIQILKKADESSLTHYMLGVCHYNLNDFNNSYAHFDAASALDMNMAEAYNNSGCCLVRLGRIEEAEVRFRTALTIRANYLDAKRNITELEKGCHSIRLTQRTLRKILNEYQ